jgi:hypothetical protein
MKDDKTPSSIQPNEAMVFVSMKLGLISAKKPLYNDKAKANYAKSSMSLLFQSGLSIFGSWLLTNYFADNGFRSSASYTHENWALQGDGVVLNALIFSTLLTAQLLKFCLQAPVLFGSEFKVLINSIYLAAVFALQMYLVFMASPGIEYDLVFNSPFDFTVLWTFLTVATFVGVKKFPFRFVKQK